jgi:hypothetical protein
MDLFFTSKLRFPIYFPIFAWFECLQMDFIKSLVHNLLDLLDRLLVQMESFVCFQKAHPNAMIRNRIFDSLRPFWVKQMKEWYVCCCICHVELEELRVALNNIQLSCSIHSKTHCKSSCEDVCQLETTKTNICTSSHATYLGLTTLWEFMICPQDEFSKCHAR